MILGTAFLAELIAILTSAEGTIEPVPQGFGSVESVGKALFGEYLFAFALS